MFSVPLDMLGDVKGTGIVEPFPSAMVRTSLANSGCQCMSYLHGVACGLAGRDGAMPQLFPKCFAFEQLGDEIRQAFKSTKPVHSQYVWMIECCGCLRLLGKTAQPVGVPRNKGWQDFDGHIPLQNRVTSAVYLAHAARTQEAENLISIDLYSRRECHSAADDCNENVGGF